MRAPPAIALAAAAAVAGCGGSDTAALLDRLPADAAIVAVADLAEAKHRLDLPDAADPAAMSADAGAGAGERRLLFSAAYALPHLQRVASNLPIAGALEPSEIETAASAGLRGEDELTVVRTAQSLDEVLEGLEQSGYRREGEMVVSPRSAAEVVYPAAAQRDGLLLLGGSAGAVRRALEGDGEGAGAARELLDAIDAPIRVAVVGRGSACMRALAGGDRLEPAEGELRVRVSGQASPGRSQLGDPDGLARGLARGARFAKPRADGDMLSIPFSYDGTTPGLSPLALVADDVRASAVYRC